MTTFIAVAFGYWGRGDTEQKAIDQCRRAGSKKNDTIIVYRNDVTDKELSRAKSTPEYDAAAPYVTDDGCTVYYGTLTKVATIERGKRKGAINGQ